MAGMRASLRALLRPVRTKFDKLITSHRFLRYQAGAMDRHLPPAGVTRLFDEHEYVLLRRHYYLPFPDQRDLSCQRDSELIGLSIDVDECFRFHDTHVAPYDAEFRQFPLEPTGESSDYHLVNGSFMAIDGNMYYGLVRSLAPSKIVEIGSGNSTKLASAAIERNAREGRRRSELVCIEPFHSEQLSRMSGVSSVLQQYVQEVDLALFESLGPGDILFIDSTHTVRPGGDVWWEICEILPRLRPGVLVHVHDVSLPKPYPAHYMDDQRYWMEQYFLQAFLTFNDRYSIVWPGNYLMLRDPDRMKARFGSEYAAMVGAHPHAEPASFWMRVN